MSTTIDARQTAGAAGQPANRPNPGPGYYARKTLKTLASLQLTVVLFVFSILLVFFGTLAQMDNGIWTVVDQYFWSWFVKVPFDLFHKFGSVFFDLSKDTQWGGWFPLPAGKLLGALLLVNLLAAHAVRFRFTWKRAGIILLHSGLILLFVGEYITREYSVEQRMTIDEGASVDYSEDSRHFELAFVEPAEGNTDHVVTVPASLLRKAESRITDPQLPVDLEVVKYMVNSALESPNGRENPATAGHGSAPGQERIAVEKPEVSGVDPVQKVDVASAYIEMFKKGTDESLGTFLVSLFLKEDKVIVDGKPIGFSLRWKRHYKPFSIHLVKFRFDRYPGTQKPKNYSSEVIIYGQDGAELRRQTIRMNEPLRFEGETFYQADFDHDTEKATILQVVKNPGWVIPYVSCVMVGLGLLLHFSMGLVRFLLRKPAIAPGGGMASKQEEAGEASGQAATGAPAASWLNRNFTWLIPAAMATIAVLYLGSVYGRMKPKGEFDLDGFSRLPVLEGGRVKPLDSVARVYLRKISHQSVFKDAKGDEQPAIRWYLDTLGAKPMDEGEAAWSYKIIRIENDQVRAELKLPAREGLRYSFNELRPHLKDLDSKARAAMTKRRAQKPLDIFEIKLLDLFEKMELLFHIAQGRGHDTMENQFHLAPPQAPGEKWLSLGEEKAAAETEACNSEIIAARKKIEAQPGGFSAELQDRLFTLIGVDPARVPADRREMIVSMFMKADPARLPAESRSEVLDMILSLLPKEEADAAKLRLEREIAIRSAANPSVVQWEKLIEARRAKKPDEFNSLLADYRANYLSQVSAKDLSHTKLEINYNRFAPFLRCIGLYVMAFLLAVFGFVSKAAELPRLGEALRRSAVLVLAITFLVHGAGLFVRMDLMNYTLVFVTNLYSSAVFIGWGCVAIGLILEIIFPIGIGNVVAAVLGVATTIVAHNLATEDTLEMMQAVLDTNFWLATHVTTVTLGYTATFVAGFLGVAYLFFMFCTVVRDSFRQPGPPTPGRLLAYGAAALGIAFIPMTTAWVLFDALGKFEVLPNVLCELLRYGMVAVGGLALLAMLLARAGADGVDSHGQPVSVPVPRFARPIADMALSPHMAKVLSQMIYGVVCFATMLSFIGTVLGGIWADQSWGRFWGWDPKENGAVLIVLMNALILHARWCGLVKDRGMAVLAVLGNMITAWSWFGTNQLGIGLHNYGFDKRLAEGCCNFWLSMATIAALGLIPRRFWTTALAPAPAAKESQPRRRGRRD